MHTGKRTRNIRLKDLKTAYLEQLRERSRARMEEYIQERTVLESELEECIWEYYRQTAPSLQEFYSRYTPEWEVFYEHETLPPTDFLIFLKRMETAFRKRYTLAELDVSYYIGRLSRLPERSEERQPCRNSSSTSGTICSRSRNTITSTSTSSACAKNFRFWINRSV